MKKETDQLTIEHLAPYLPYDVMVQWSNKEIKPETMDCRNMNVLINQNFKPIVHKPILRPLSDLVKEITHNGLHFIPVFELLRINHADWWSVHKNDRYGKMEIVECPAYLGACFSNQATKDVTFWVNQIETTEYWMIQKLFGWHFDVFGLIEKGFALDINKYD